MYPKEWAKACGYSRESFAMRWKILVAELSSECAGHKHICMGQLQLNRWHDCHSLHLNLWRLSKAAGLSALQVEEVSSASKTLPLLRCLHLIGRDQVTFTESSIEGILLRLVARHASVLTLQVKTVDMPLDFLPKLQHLALDLDANPTTQGIMQTHESLFSAIGMLKGLRTLYMQSTRQVGNQQPSQVCKTIKIAKADLTACAHLQHVALRGVGLDGELILPDGCCLHATGEPGFLGKKVGSVRQLMTGLFWRGMSDQVHGPLRLNLACIV